MKAVVLVGGEGTRLRPITETIPKPLVPLMDRPSLDHVLDRGDFLKPTKQVSPGTPAFLHPFPDSAPRNRLGLARWLVDRRSPTTARSPAPSRTRGDPAG